MIPKNIQLSKQWSNVGYVSPKFIKCIVDMAEFNTLWLVKKMLRKEFNDYILQHHKENIDIEPIIVPLSDKLIRLIRDEFMHLNKEMEKCQMK